MHLGGNAVGRVEELNTHVHAHTNHNKQANKHDCFGWR